MERIVAHNNKGQFLIMANSPQLNPSNSRGLKTKGVEFDPLGKKGGNE